MPKEYTDCKKSYMDKGISEKVASARCAAMYYKRHGVTVNEAAKKAGESTIPLDDALIDTILKADQITASAAEIQDVTDKLKSEVIATEMPGLESDGLFELIATRDGARAFTSDGYIVTWLPSTLAQMAHTWTGGQVTANHAKNKSYGSILASWYEAPNVHMLVKVNDEMAGWIVRNRGKGIGVSIESTEITHKDGNIQAARGTNVTIVFPPHTPGCSPDEGCYVMGTEPDTAESAKLTTEKRNELSDESFCGPDRSFPAHDAAHVRNGLARLSQSNASPEEKAKIHACLAKRAKKYGIEVAGTWDNYTITPEEGENADGKSASVEETDVNNGENMAEEKTVSATDYQKVTAELEAAKKTMAELQQFKENEVAKRKAATLGVIAGYVDATPYKDAPLCTLEAVASALEAHKKKLDAAPVQNSGASAVSSTNETERKDNALPAGFKDEAEFAAFKVAAEKAKKYGRDIKVS